MNKGEVVCVYSDHKTREELQSSADRDYTIFNLRMISLLGCIRTKNIIMTNAHNHDKCPYIRHGATDTCQIGGPFA